MWRAERWGLQRSAVRARRATMKRVGRLLDVARMGLALLQSDVSRRLSCGAGTLMDGFIRPYWKRYENGTTAYIE